MHIINWIHKLFYIYSNKKGSWNWLYVQHQWENNRNKYIFTLWLCLSSWYIVWDVWVVGCPLYEYKAVCHQSKWDYFCWQQAYFLAVESGHGQVCYMCSSLFTMVQVGCSVFEVPCNCPAWMCDEVTCRLEQCLHVLELTRKSVTC